MKKLLMLLLLMAVAGGLVLLATSLDSQRVSDQVQASVEALRPPVEQTAGATEPAGEAAPEQTGEPAPSETLPPETEPTQPEKTSFLLTFAGDCTLGSQVAHTVAGYGFDLTVGEDKAYPMRNVEQYFAQDDFSMVNLEGPLCDKLPGKDGTFVFRGPREHVAILSEHSVEAVTLANNHILDYYQDGYDQTLQTLEDAGMSYVEPESTMLYELEGGLTIGVYAETYQDMDMERLTASVKSLRDQGAELVIYAVHWGAEYHYHPAAQQVDWAHQAVDAGVNIVYGSHPHVLQPVEEYNGGVIFYSLANFIFGGNIYPKDYDTAIMQQQVLRSADGTVELGELTVIPASSSSVSGRNNYQPTPYEQGSAEYNRVMDRLAWEE